MSYKITKLTEPAVLGEGPHWDDRQQALYYVSIFEKTIHKYVPATREYAKTKLDDEASFIIPVEGTLDQFLISQSRTLLIIRWDGKNGSPVTVVREIGVVDQHLPKNKMNDGKADPRGRLFAGTLSNDEEFRGQFPRHGSIYRVDGTRSLTPERVETNISLANGLAWDLEEKAFYYIDTLEPKIRRYDYDVETGDISNQTFIYEHLTVNIKEMRSLDGMTIDTDGNLWVAFFKGSSVLHINPKTGKLIREIPMPVPQVTSVTFGGPNMDILFVTTASMTIFGEQPPDSGATFMVEGLGVKGHKNDRFKLQ